MVIFLGLWVLQIPIRIMDWEANLVSFPDFLFHNIAILIAFLCYKSVRIGVPVGLAYFAFLVFMYLNGYSLYIHYLNFGTLSGRVSETCPPFDLYMEDSTKVSNDSFNNKILVLDFWNTGCGVCFRKFPELEEKFLKYQGQKVEILFIHDPDILKKLKIQWFPTTLVITNGNTIVFRGDIEKIDDFVGLHSQ
jgi:thiol-disulfide isomerase/thioredoxin